MPPEFAILEGFAALQENHFKEKVKTQKMWAEREKQLDKILAAPPTSTAR